MVETSIITAQRLIDAKAYPPTHDYDVETLTPRYPLNERVERILALCPDFFEGDRFLDVGCSKGFFSLRAAQGYRKVVAIDPDAEALAAWEPIRPPNVTVHNVRFDQFQDEDVFDMVWIGNGPHYLYRDHKNWISHLGMYAHRRVVMEGPIDARCPDLKNFGPYQTEIELIEAMEDSRFRLIGQYVSPTYTPGRMLWYFKTPW